MENQSPNLRFFKNEDFASTTIFVNMKKIKSRRDYPNWIYSNRIEIGDQLKSIRLNFGISAKMLAERCNIDASNLCRAELGKYNLSLDLLSLIVNELGYKIKLVPIYGEDNA